MKYGSLDSQSNVKLKNILSTYISRAGWISWLNVHFDRIKAMSRIFPAKAHVLIVAMQSFWKRNIEEL